MIHRILATLFCILLCASPLHALIYQVDVYRSPHGALIFLCKDEHTCCSDDDAGDEQFEVITKMLKKHRNKANIILECNSDYQGDDQALHNVMRQTRTASAALPDAHLLTTLFSYCKEKNIPFTNVDDRTLNELSMMGDVPISQVLQTYITGLKEILANDADKPEDIITLIMAYKTIIRNEKFIAQLLEQKTKTLKKLSEQIKHEKKKQKFTDQCDNFSDPILEARLLNQIAQHTSTDPLIAFIGGEHIDRIKPHLPAIGCIYSHTLGQEPEYEDDHATISAESLFDINELAQHVNLAKKLQRYPASNSLKPDKIDFLLSVAQIVDALENAYEKITKKSDPKKP